jgi:hypothetical protein
MKSKMLHDHSPDDIMAAPHRVGQFSQINVSDLL